MKKPFDHALAVIKAAVSGLPLVGGPIASLISDYIPFSTQRSIDQAFQMLGERLEQLGDRIDVDAADKDEFVELFKTCYLTIVRTHHQEKLRAATNIVANVLLRAGDPEKLCYIELDHISRALDALSMGAIGLLAGMVRRAKSKEPRNHGKQSIRLDFGEVNRQNPEIEHFLLMGLLEELNAFHLVHLTGAPGVRTPQYGNYPIEVTPLGVRFIEYIVQGNDEG